MHLLTNFLSILMIFRNWTNMPYRVDNMVICAIMLLSILYLYKVITKLTKQYTLIHNSIIENNGVL